MNWSILDGMYPYNSLWQFNTVVIIAFELAVCFLEFFVIDSFIRHLLKDKKSVSWTDDNSLNLLIMVSIANIFTFALGFLLNLLVGYR
jgi:hypothetical protein